MSYRQNGYLEDLCEMRSRVKETLGEHCGSDEEMFVEEFRHGQYHEEHADWCGIAMTLSKEQLCQSTLAVIHVLIAGRVENQRGSKLKTIMRFYSAIRQWAIGGCDSVDDILIPLGQMKSLVVESARAESRGWWGDTVRLFSLVHIGMLGNLGLDSYEVSAEYGVVVDQLCNPGENRRK